MTATLVAAVLAAASLAPRASADTITIDFDSLSPDSTGVLTGSTVTTYLAGYGVTLENMLSGQAAYVLDASNANANYLTPSSPNNAFLVAGGGQVRSFDLKFTGVVDNLSFTRVGTEADNSPSGTIMGPWTATAYSALGVNLGSVSASTISTYGDVGNQTYTFNVTGISYITFSGDHLGYAGFALPVIDDITYSAVPEPTSLALLGLGLAGVAWRKRRKASAA
jgi:hypothetical protein